MKSGRIESLSAKLSFWANECRRSGDWSQPPEQFWRVSVSSCNKIKFSKISGWKEMLLIQFSLNVAKRHFPHLFFFCCVVPVLQDVSSSSWPWHPPGLNIVPVFLARANAYMLTSTTSRKWVRVPEPLFNKMFFKPNREQVRECVAPPSASRGCNW